MNERRVALNFSVRSGEDFHEHGVAVVGTDGSRCQFELHAVFASAAGGLIQESRGNARDVSQGLGHATGGEKLPE